jgi:porphobilinogen deaminase
MQAGCLAPVGVLARRARGRMVLNAFVGLKPGQPMRLWAEDEVRNGLALGQALADKALAMGSGA